MPLPGIAHTAARVAKRLPVLKAVPLVELLMLAEVVLLAREHYERLTLAERRRLVALIKRARGRPRTLSDDELAELQAILAKAAPRRFATEAITRVSPVPIPSMVKDKLAGGPGGPGGPRGPGGSGPGGAAPDH